MPGSRSSQSQKTDIVIIGAGLAGLAAAVLLASNGYRVVITERNNSPGGKMQEIQAGEFRFDTGPSLLTMPSVLELLFARAGISRDRLNLIKMEPLCRYFYPDGSVFNASVNREKSLEAVRRLAPEDLTAYSKFLDDSEILYRRTADAFLFNPLYEWGDLKHLNLRDLFRIDAFRTVSQSIDQRFQSDYLRKFFKRFTTYNGSSPYQAPATLNVIPHVELTLGGYYLQGGLYRLAETLEARALELGVDIQYNSTVREIEVIDGAVRGVQLETGQRIFASRVLSNSDATETFRKLLPRSAQKGWRDWLIRRQEPSSSGFVLLLGCNRSWDMLSHHNIFFSEQYEKEFASIFDEGIVPDDPTIYVTNSSCSDPADAPEDGSNLFILINVPSLSKGDLWEEQDSYRLAKRLTAKLEAAGLAGLEESVVNRHWITPMDFYNRFRTNEGSIYGSSSNKRLSAFLRPANKVREVNGLYLAGGSTHPGGGIPLVLLSAMHAVDLIQRTEDG